MTFKAPETIQLFDHVTFRSLLKTQDELNKRLNPGWQFKNWDFMLALADECMEVMGHMGWKWWKDTDKYQIGITPENSKQIELELTDILHFLLSYMLQVYGDPDRKYWKETTSNPFMVSDSSAGFGVNYGAVTCRIKDMMALAQDNDRSASVKVKYIARDFTWLVMAVTQCDPAKFIASYAGKVALNAFRWNNGYANGSYQKVWDVPGLMKGQDNDFLELALSQVLPAHSSFEGIRSHCTELLGGWYSKRVK